MEKKLRALGIAVAMATALATAQYSSSGVSSTVYRIRVGDAVRIMVYNEQQVNSIQTVYPDGRISVPFIGPIEFAGRTTSEVEQELVNLYRDKLHIKEPKVSVTIEMYRPIKANVTGAILSGGSYEQFKYTDSLLTLISRGGGPVPDRADLRRATLTRADSREVIPINLYDMLIHGDMSQNYSLEDGDTLYIPFRQFEGVNVQGAVIQPGAYPFKEGMTIVDAVSLAHGWIPTRSKMSEVVVMRKKQGSKNELTYYKLNYVKLLHGDLSQNMELYAGDTIYVTETKTPDVNQISAIFNAVFFVDRFFSDGFFGFKLFK